MRQRKAASGHGMKGRLLADQRRWPNAASRRARSVRCRLFGSRVRTRRDDAGDYGPAVQVVGLNLEAAPPCEGNHRLIVSQDLAKQSPYTLLGRIGDKRLQQFDAKSTPLELVCDSNCKFRRALRFIQHTSSFRDDEGIALLLAQCHERKPSPVILVDQSFEQRHRQFDDCAEEAEVP